MGIFQKAMETYDNMESIAGKEFKEKVTLAPIGFIYTGVQIVITLTKDGKFEKSEEIFIEKTDDKDKPKKFEKKIIIPATEKSSGRSSGSAKTTPHPLCDKLMFMCPDYEDSYRAYITQLEDWCNSEFSVPQIKAILKYVKGGTVHEDVASAVNVKDEDFICWRVRSTDASEEEDIWRNKAVIESYVKYCQKKISEKLDKGLCYVTGKMLPVAEQHLKGVVSYSGNAKLISANDTSNFTYRGRFADDNEALSVSFIASQKAHNALKWVVANDGIRIGDRSIVCWNPKGKKIPKPTVSLFSKLKIEEEKVNPSNYREILAKAVLGYRSSLDVNDETVTAVFEAATTGRLSISYYSEMKAEDFLERLCFWDETSSWEHPFYGVTSPDLRRIVEASYGTLRSNENMQSIETDEKIMAEMMQRLLLCRIEKSPFPLDIMRNAVQKCSSLQLYDESGKNNRLNQLFTTCAIIKKYRFDHLKEEWIMALEPEKKDRSYQYGRLLAVMEKAEKDTYDAGEKRETNAIRMQPFFVKRPMHTAKIVIEQLKNAYFQRLSTGSRSYYDKLIGEIMLQLSEFPETEVNKPLSETYLMGYYLQKNSFYKKKNNDNIESEEQEK